MPNTRGHRAEHQPPCVAIALEGHRLAHRLTRAIEWRHRHRPRPRQRPKLERAKNRFDAGGRAAHRLALSATTASARASPSGQEAAARAVACMSVRRANALFWGDVGFDGIRTSAGDRKNERTVAYPVRTDEQPPLLLRRPLKCYFLNGVIARINAHNRETRGDPQGTMAKSHVRTIFRNFCLNLKLLGCDRISLSSYRLKRRQKADRELSPYTTFHCHFLLQYSGTQGV